MQLSKPEKREPRPRKPIVRRTRPSPLGKLASRGALRKLADDYFSLYIRSRDIWRCRRCGSGERPQCAHVLPKGAYPAGRYLESNAMCLCAGCHRYFTSRWYEWQEFVTSTMSGGAIEFTALATKARTYRAPHDYVEVARRYRTALYSTAPPLDGVLDARARRLGVIGRGD